MQRSLFASALPTGNPYFQAIPAFDLPQVFIMVAGLLGIIASTDAISGAREEGTLALALSYPVPRSRWLLGEICGSITAIALPVTATVLIAAIAIGTRADVTSAVGFRLLAIWLASIAVAMFFVLVGYLASIAARSSLTAVAWALAVWAFLNLGGPVVAGLVSRHQPLSSRSDKPASSMDLRDEASSRIELREQEVATLSGLRLVLPTDLYREAVERLTGSDLGSLALFLRFAEQRNRALAEWQTRGIQASPERLDKYRFGADLPLPIGNLGDAGSFVSRASPLGRAQIYLAMLICWDAFMLAAALLSFERHDPR